MQMYFGDGCLSALTGYHPVPGPVRTVGHSYVSMPFETDWLDGEWVQLNLRELKCSEVIIAA